MKILNLVQGSAEWMAHRRTTRNASDASVMMGASPNISRRELVRLRATGLDREFSDYVQKHILDKGHEVEPALRAFAEAIIGEDLYPVVAVSDDDYIGASYDGLTIGDEWILEAKQYSAAKAECIAHGEIPSVDYWQIVQQFAVNGAAERCLYVVGDGSPERTSHLVVERAEVESDIPTLLAGWRQFDADVAAYEAPTVAEVVVKPARIPGEALPAIFVQVHGQVTVTENFQAFEARAMDFLDRELVRNPQTDDDFGALEDQIKEIKRAEAALDASGAQVLAQVETLDTFMRRKDQLSKLLRDNRLLAEKLLTSEKERRRAEIVEAGKQSVIAHYQQINASLGEHALAVPLREITADLGAAIKGKRSLASMQDAVDSLAAQHKVAASQVAERVRACMRVLEMEVGPYGSLFPDAVQLCATKQPEDLRNLVTARIAEHQQKEQARLDAERERIRQEEVARLEREQAEKAAADSSPGIATAGGVPNSGEVPDRVRHTTGSGSHAQGDGTPAAGGPATAAAAPLRRIKLGEINAAIAPLSINAEGLAQLGFLPAGKERSAVLYDAAQVPAMCQAMQRILAKAAVGDQLRQAA